MKCDYRKINITKIILLKITAFRKNCVWPCSYPLIKLHRSVHSGEFTQLTIPQYVFESLDRSHSLSQQIVVKFNSNSDSQNGKASLGVHSS
jgi:hypothetical protein